MFTRAAALAAIALAATAGATLGAASWAQPMPRDQWWEKLTVTVPASGEARCVFSSSREASKACAIAGPASLLSAAAPENGQTTTITFERRFNAGAEADTSIAAGDMLLGGQVMHLSLDRDGRVAGCRVIEKAEGMDSDYGCAEAKAERFEAGKDGEARLTILIYAHNEEVV